MTAVVIPQFERAFSGLGVELPPLTRAVFRAGAWMESRWPALIFLIFALALAVKLALRSARLRPHIDGALLKILYSEICCSKPRSRAPSARWRRCFAPDCRCSHRYASPPQRQATKKYAPPSNRRATARRRGRDSAPRSAAVPVFPRMIVHMAAVGEETGRSAEMFEKIAGWYESELSEKVRRLSSILEPVMVVIVGAAVGVMAVAVFMPSSQR